MIGQTPPVRCWYFCADIEISTLQDLDKEREKQKNIVKKENLDLYRLCATANKLLSKMCDVVVGSVVPDTASRPLTTRPAGQERALLPPPVTWPPGQEVGGGRPPDSAL